MKFNEVKSSSLQSLYEENNVSRSSRHAGEQLCGTVGRHRRIVLVLVENVAKPRRSQLRLVAKAMIEIGLEGLRVSAGNADGDVFEALPGDVEADETLDLAVIAVQSGGRQRRHKIRRRAGRGGGRRRRDVAREKVDEGFGVGDFEDTKPGLAFGHEIDEAQLRIVKMTETADPVVHHLSEERLFRRFRRRRQRRRILPERDFPHRRLGRAGSEDASVFEDRRLAELVSDGVGAKLARGDGFRGGITSPSMIVVEDADEAVSARGRQRASVGTPRNAADEIGMSELPDSNAGVDAPENDLVIRGGDGEKVIVDDRMPTNLMNIFGVL